MRAKYSFMLNYAFAYQASRLRELFFARLLDNEKFNFQRLHGQHLNGSYEITPNTSRGMQLSLYFKVLMTSGAKTRKSWHNITSKNILLSDHCSLGHLFMGPPPITHRASGGPTKNMCLRKSASIIIDPPSLSHHTRVITCRVGTARSVMS